MNWLPSKWFGKTDPPCSKWNIWYGGEVEGADDLGVKTIFVRDLKDRSLASLRKDYPHIHRIWFCDEFRDWVTIEEALSLYHTVCITVNYPISRRDFENIPMSILRRAKFYWRISVESWLITALSALECHICLGKPYEELIVKSSYGSRVSKEIYCSDTKIL
jgi:hypothetical protein